MNIQEDLKTYFEANPVSNFKNLAKLKSWELVNDGFDSAAFYVEGVWKNYLFSLLWLEKDQQLKLTCEYDLNPKKENMSSFYKTLNLANEKCSEGHFTFCDNEKILVFHNQFKGSISFRLHLQGIRNIQSLNKCTFTEKKNYFSFRRNQKNKLGDCGRMISTIKI